MQNVRIAARNSSSWSSNQQPPPFANGAPTMVIWRLTDGKPGHDAQSLGLVQALAARRDVHAVAIECPGIWRSLSALARNRFNPSPAAPSPDLLVGAGHATHLPMLAARRSFGARCVVLMAPSLPIRLFDLCIVPQHDGLPDGENLVNSVGPLNPIIARPQQHSDRGLMLIGGASRHFHWPLETITAQIEALAMKTPAIQWQITDSRRSSVATGVALAAIAQANVEFISHSQTPDGWVAARLAECAQVWVSADSVSMIYEALTSGAAVGLFDIAEKNPSRVARGLQQLREQGRVTGFKQWLADDGLPAPQQPLAEAGRCADLILTRWFQD